MGIEQEFFDYLFILFEDITMTNQQTKHALIVGGSSGMGFAIAKQIQSQGVTPNYCRSQAQKTESRQTTTD
jgi:short-subunit dehydrogenase involved in D-alanine esterification of teichoic acids